MIGAQIIEKQAVKQYRNLAKSFEDESKMTRWDAHFFAALMVIRSFTKKQNGGKLWNGDYSDKSVNGF